MISARVYFCDVAYLLQACPDRVSTNTEGHVFGNNRSASTFRRTLSMFDVAPHSKKRYKNVDCVHVDRVAQYSIAHGPTYSICNKVL